MKKETTLNPGQLEPDVMASLVDSVAEIIRTEYMKIPFTDLPRCDTGKGTAEIIIPKIIQWLVKQVEREAEKNILKTGKLDGAHYAAMKKLEAAL